MYFDEIEAACCRALLRGGFLGVANPAQRAVAASLGIRIRHSSPDHTEGWSVSQMRTLLYRPTGDVYQDEDTLGHELAEHIALDAALPGPQEDEVMDEGSRHLRMPVWGLRPLVAQYGLSPALCHNYPLVRPSELFAWAAHVTENHVAWVRVGRRSMQVSSCRYLETSVELPDALALARQVRAERRPLRDPVLWGLQGWPFVEDGMLGVLVVADLKRLPKRAIWHR